jgi:hypothetical protein
VFWDSRVGVNPYVLESISSVEGRREFSAASRIRRSRISQKGHSRKFVRARLASEHLNEASKGVVGTPLLGQLIIEWGIGRWLAVSPAGVLRGF